MRAVNNYILLVDYHRPRKRSVSGRYRVGAKDKKEAIALLRKAIGVGSIQVYYQCRKDDPKAVAYKCVVKEEARTVEKDGRAVVVMVHTAPLHFTARRQKLCLELQ